LVAKKSALPDLDSFTVGLVPTTKFVPVRFLIGVVVPLNAEFGEILVTVGAEPGEVTVKPFESVAGGLEGLVTTTSH
jgi:hypothetical protein